MSELPSPPESPADPRRSSVRFTLRVPPTFGPRLFETVLIAVAFVLVLFAGPMLADGDGLYLLALIAVAAIVPSLLALVGASARKRGRASIEVLDDRVLLPTGGQGRVAVRFTSLRGLFLRRRRLAGFLYVATEDREFVFPTRAFPDDGAERLHDLLHGRIQASGADGERRLRDIDRSSDLAHRAFSRTPVVTWSVLAVMATVHLYMFGFDRIVGVLDVAAAGAVSPELVAAAGPYLALTAHWVHGWMFQPLLVLPALLVAGTMVERLLGHGACALVLLGSGLAGGLAAAYFPGAPLHSGGLVMVAGAVGALIHTRRQTQGQLPIGFRLNGQWWSWIVTVGAVAALVHGLSIPGVLVGLLFGVGAAVFLLEDAPEVPLAYSPRWAALGAGLLIALHVAAAGWAIEDLGGRRLELTRIAVENHHNQRALREFARQVARAEPRQSEARLELALTAVDRALDLTEAEVGRVLVQGTRALVLERLGRLPEAAATVHAILQEQPRRFGAAHRLAELLREIDERVVIEGEDPGPGRVRLETRTATHAVASVTVERPSAQARRKQAP